MSTEQTHAEQDAILDTASDSTATPSAAPLLDDPMALAGALGGGDPMALLMSQLGASNPQAAMMLRMMEERNRARDTERLQEEQEQAAQAAAQREQDIEELRQTVQRACAELDILHQRNDALADALGACRLCFGTDPLCEQCHGRGRSGGRAPDPAAFRTWVLPAVRRAQAIEARRKQSHSPTPTQQAVPRQQSYSQPYHYTPQQQPAPARQTGIQP